MSVASSTVVQLSIGELVGILAFVLGALYGLARMIVSQMRASMDSRFQSLEQTTAALEQEVEKFNRLLPLEYVRREDWIRFSASIDAKLDRLADMLMKRRE